VAGGSIPPDTKQRLYEALLGVRTMHDRELRDLYLSELESQLGHSLGMSRHADTRPDVRYLLNACLAHDGALRGLVTIVRQIHGDTAQIREVERLVMELERQAQDLGPDGRRVALPRTLGSSQREQLARLVEDLAPGRLAAAFGQVVGQVPGEGVPDWLDVRTVIAQLDMIAPTPERDLVLLRVIDRLAHSLGGSRALELHVWIDEAGTELGFDQTTIRGLCRSTSAGLAGRVPVPAHAGAPAPVSQAEELVVPENQRQREDAVTRILALSQPSPDQIERSGRIWGGMPIRNPDFTGREQIITGLRQALVQRSKASVLPETLHGFGGVGKTQLAIEYVYRHADHYDLVWWIPAEHPSSVRASLAQLGERLGLPASDDMQQTARMVLDVLSGPSPLRWLLVYDNADAPEDITPLLPGGSGGHVIVTSRNQEWARAGGAIEVDVFQRAESIALLQRRGEGISERDADRLADKLGDLPLALEQAATWQAATGMPVSEYLQLFDEHVQELLSEGKPTYYPDTVFAFLHLAMERLRERTPGAAELLELFAFLSSEPLSTTLLRSGRSGGLSERLAEALAEPIGMNRVIRELRRYGLAKVDPSGQTIQVHRLVQVVLREELRADRRERSRSNVQRLLAAANPGFPLERRFWPLYEDIGPHILPAGLVDAADSRGRAVVLDHARYLYRVGDYEGSRELAEMAVTAWSRPVAEGGLGPDDGQTLTAKRRLANALRQLGNNAVARELDEDTLTRLRHNPEFGEDHEDTLAAANSVALNLRLAGDFRAAYELDQENVAKHRRVFGDDDQSTLTMRNNLAVNLRLLGDFQASYDIDRAVVEQWQQTLGPDDVRTLFSISNLARDLYGLGRYAEALEMQRQAWPLMRDQLGPRHNEVLLAARTIAIALRKTGQYEDALYQARENYRSYHTRFGPDHEHTLAATMSYANTLREIGEWSEARTLASEAVQRYVRLFGQRHAFTLAATTNLAIILRSVGHRRQARELDEATLAALRQVLGAEHPYTLCVASGLANDLALEGNVRAARELSDRTLTLSRRVRGQHHPYTLACAVNAADDLRRTGEEPAAQTLLDEAVDALRTVLGPDHPDTVDAARGKRAECDIEPPPT
jgi:tetratricopeptide (TPR) repeat protein